MQGLLFLQHQFFIMRKNITNALVVLVLFGSILTITTACGGESSSDTTVQDVSSQVSITSGDGVGSVIQTNGKTTITCRTTGTGTAIVNGQKFKCENGRLTKQ